METGSADDRHIGIPDGNYYGFCIIPKLDRVRNEIESHSKQCLYFKLVELK